ncbi:Na+/melibiose symporter-like transporter [Actinoplanes tereljensis]|uniref:MFS transporter n=1 Tax=Paractinoplanes tereljensis TaxID=571912 RepID=A0A919NX77_9ACTN|nr:MFS transporter [Actinoplanes tereljensis]GIF27001.1 MFS transporter [Actinoplanes tereljensis]
MGRDYRLLLAANFVSFTGDWILSAGLVYQVYALTGSALASAAMVLATLIPQVTLGSFAGVLADRWDRRRTMIGCNLLLAVTLLPLLLVTDPSQVPLVYAVAAVQSALAVGFASAEAALVPSLVDAHRLVTANALNGQARDVARLVGAALGGVLAAAGGIRLIAVADAATFAAAAGLLALIRYRALRPGGQAAAPRVLREWLDGTRIAVSDRTLRVLMVFALITGVGEAIMMTLMAPFVRDVLHGGNQTYGTIMAAQAVGGLAGGALATLVGHRFAPRLLLGGGAVAFGLLDLVLFLYPLVHVATWPAYGIMVLVGLPGALTVAGLVTVFQTATDDSYRGRVFGAITALRAGAMLVGIVLAGTLAGRAGIVPVIAVQGAGYLAAGLLVLAALPRSARPAVIGRNDSSDDATSPEASTCRTP